MQAQSKAHSQKKTSPRPKRRHPWSLPFSPRHIVEMSNSEQRPDPQEGTGMNWPSAKTQRARILGLLLDARDAWVPLPEIMACAAQYNARIWELRNRLGFEIENKTECDDSGVVHSWYRLVKSPAPPNSEPAKPAAGSAPRFTGLLFDMDPRP